MDKKWLALSGVALAIASSIALTQGASAANFSLSEPFDTPGPLSSTWVTSGTVDPFVANDSSQTPANAMQLTSNDYDQRGFALYNQLIPVDQGLDIRFTQAQWQGDGGADGIVFFVKDAANTDTQPGAGGGGLGYAPDEFVLTPGISGALLGVGFDGYGNFDENRSEGDDCNHAEFVNYAWPEKRNSLVVRGPGDGLVGYCRLADTFVLADNGLPNLVGSSRADAARHIRITIDPANIADPRVKVYYEDTLVFDIPEPVEFGSVSGIKMGFSAGTGGETDHHDIWGLTVESLVKVDDPVLAETGLDPRLLIIGLCLVVVGGVIFVTRRPRQR